MLEVKVSKEGIKMMSMGSGLEMLADVSMIINKLYSALYNQDPRSGEAFKSELQRAIADHNWPGWEPTKDGKMVVISSPRENGGNNT